MDDETYTVVGRPARPAASGRPGRLDLLFDGLYVTVDSGVVAFADALAATLGVVTSLPAAWKSLSPRYAVGVARGTRTASGIAIGVIAALGVSRLLSGTLFGIDAASPFVYVSVAMLSFAAAAIGCAVPAWRASRVDPLLVLKAE